MILRVSFCPVPSKTLDLGKRGYNEQKIYYVLPSSVFYHCMLAEICVAEFVWGSVLFFKSYEIILSTEEATFYISIHAVTFPDCDM